MVERYKYKAINTKGRPIRGMVSAVSENDLYKQLQSAGLELIDCSIVGKKNSSLSLGLSFMNKVNLRDLIQFFVHLDQMQSAGISLLDALMDIRDTTDKIKLRDVVTEMHRDISDGMSLSEAMRRHPKVFKPLYISLIEASEETGDMTSAYRQLVKYLKWLDEITSKVRKATRYPMIVTAVVLLTIVFMMAVVVPQITGFLTFVDLELPWFTVALIATSDFFANPLFHFLGLPIYGGLVVLLMPFLIYAFVRFLRKSSEGVAYKIDEIYLKLPVVGNLIRKITIVRYAQTFGALYAGGINVISALKSARETVSNLVMMSAMQAVETQVQSGATLSKAFNASGEFPSMVVNMLKVGEESGNLTEVLTQISEFYAQDINEAIEGIIEMIQPTLTAILGLMIAWIAAGSLGPIYMNLGNMVDM